MPLPAEHVYASSPGPKAVATVDELILGGVRDGSAVAVRVHHPLGPGGPWPVVLFSHGFGGRKDLYTDLVRGWTQHGYAVVQPTHADGGELDRTAWAEHHAPAYYRRRVSDLVAVLDRLDEIGAQLPHLDAGLDAARVGAAGHSLGAYVCQLLGGVRPSWAREGRVSLADPRVRAVAVLSGSGRSARGDAGLDDKGLDDEAWRGLDRPLLNVTGSRDRGRGGGPEWRRQPYELAPPGDRYQAFFAGGDHGLGGIAGPERGPGPPLADDPVLREAVEQLTLAFWDAHVRGLDRARSWLTSAAPAAMGAPNLEFTFK